jgi:hypothetical protein
MEHRNPDALIGDQARCGTLTLQCSLCGIVDVVGVNIWLEVDQFKEFD